MNNLSKKLLAALIIISTTVISRSTALARDSAPVWAPLIAQQEQASQARGQAYLIKEVRHELVMLPYYNLFDWLEYEVQPDGAVILRGEVVRPTLKSDAEHVVKRIEGVTQVVNQIEVLPLSPNDERIRRAVYQAIFNWNSPLFRYATQAVPSIHIIVKNGNVTLKGLVDTQADRDLANIKARGVPGAFEVKNDLHVEKD
jgi:hyperosmotically inducible periplasmic protein